MPGLNRHSKLITPGGILMIAIAAVVASIFIFDIDVRYHSRGMMQTLSEMARFVFGSR